MNQFSNHKQRHRIESLQEFLEGFLFVCFTQEFLLASFFNFPIEIQALSNSKITIKTEANKMTFGEAIEALKSGQKVCREGWNGKGIYIELQRPDEHSKMTQPYIYIVTTGLQSDNPAAPRGVVPWLASQTDMLAEDWQLY